MSEKTIIIQQGLGDEALEMTVRVTSEEFNKMEEIRKSDPSVWEGKGLDLVRAAKEAVQKDSSNGNGRDSKHFNWKLLLAVVLGITIVVGIVIFAERNRNSFDEVKEGQQLNECDIIHSNYIHYLWELSSEKGYSDENRFKDELNKDRAKRKQFYENLKLGNPNFKDSYYDFEKWWLYDVLTSPIYGLNLGSIREYDSLFDNNEESRKWLWDKANQFSIDVGENIDEFVYLAVLESDNVHKLYLKATENGLAIDEQTFRLRLFESEKSRRDIFFELKEKGMPDNYVDFLNYIGFQVDWQKVLTEFITTIDVTPTLTKEDLFDFFPEFGYDDKMLQAAFDYEATVKSGKYTDETELRSKFPEFWPEANDVTIISDQLKSFSSKQYKFTYFYNDKEFHLVEKINKGSHCVMKLQSPVDVFKSALVSVWEEPDAKSSDDPDFIAYCQSTDRQMGGVICSAVKTKVSGVDALKSELIINPPMGGECYTAIYRMIYRNRMYMLNVYIPIEEYNKDKSYGEKCADNFKFN